MAQNQEGQQQAGQSRDSRSSEPPPPEPTDEEGWGEIPRWAAKRPWPVVLFIGLFVIALLAWLTDACTQSHTIDVVLPLVTFIWVALLFAWFISCFTGEAYQNRTRTIEFAYFFMVLSFGLVAVMIADIGKATKFGVVEGCIENLDPNNRSPIQCDYPIRAVWGVEAAADRAAADKAAAEKAAADKAAEKAAAAKAADEKIAAAKAVVAKAAAAKESADQDAAAAKAAADKAPDDKAAADKALTAKAAADKAAIDKTAADKALDDLQKSGAAGRQQEAAAGSGAPAVASNAPTYAQLKEIYLKNENYHYLLNIGGHLDELRAAKPGNCPKCKPGEPKADVPCRECAAAVYAVRGGLPVPVYFILLALIGGAISLAKNVPVIHKRSDDTWVGTLAEPRLTPGEVRELLLFQVLQFISAPLLAVAAYHTIKPESFGTTVTLGFLVGFGSDQILAAIRNMVKPGQTAVVAQPAMAGSIKGVVTRGTVPEPKAAVVVKDTAFRTTSNDKGEFTLLAIPVRPEPYTLEVTSDDKTKNQQVTVSVAAPKENQVKIDLA